MFFRKKISEKTYDKENLKPVIKAQYGIVGELEKIY